MNEEQKFYMRQKAAGLVMLLFCLVCLLIFRKDAVVVLILGPLGIMCLLSNERIWMNDEDDDEEDWL